MHLLARAKRVHLETLGDRRPKAKNEMVFRVWNQDPGAILVAVKREHRRDSRRGRGVGQEAGTLNDAREHRGSLAMHRRIGNAEAHFVRFFQSVTNAATYARRMKILVTGATGKVGSRLSKRLAHRGDEVRALVRDPARATGLREARIELVEGDLLHMDSLATAVRGMDAVVHCAAFFRGATPEQAHAVNDLGTQNLAQAARAAAVKRFIFTSTGLVYGPTGGRFSREDDVCSPIAAYPVSKLAAERFLLALDGLNTYVLRLPFVYGDGDPHIAEVVPMMRGFPPTQRMSIAHHVDVAHAISLLLDAVAPAHRIYNVVDNEAPDLATLFASVGAPPPDGSNAELARSFESVADGQRIREDLGFTPRYPRLADAIAAGTC